MQVTGEGRKDTPDHGLSRKRRFSLTPCWHSSYHERAGPPLVYTSEYETYDEATAAAAQSSKDAGLRTLCRRLLKRFFLRLLSHRGAETPTRAETADTVRYSN